MTLRPSRSLSYDICTYVTTYLNDINDRISWSIITRIIYGDTYEHILFRREDISKYSFHNIDYISYLTGIVKLPSAYPIYINRIFYSFYDYNIIRYNIPSNVVFKIIDITSDSDMLGPHQINFINDLIKANKNPSETTLIVDSNIANDEQIHELLSVYPDVRFVVSLEHDEDVLYDDYHITKNIPYDITGTISCYKQIRLNGITINTSDTSYKLDINSSTLTVYLANHEYEIIFGPHPTQYTNIILHGDQSTVKLIFTKYTGFATSILQKIKFDGVFVKKQLNITISTRTIDYIRQLPTNIFDGFAPVLINNIEHCGTYDEYEISYILDELKKYGLTLNKKISCFTDGSIGTHYIKKFMWNNESILHQYYDQLPSIRYIKRIFGQPIISGDALDDITSIYKTYGCYILFTRPLVFDFKFEVLCRNITSGGHTVNLYSDCTDTSGHLKFTDIEIYVPTFVDFSISYNHDSIVITKKSKYGQLYVKKLYPWYEIKFGGYYSTNCHLVTEIPPH